MAEYLTNTTDLTAVADAIRAKGGTAAQLVYPSGFVSAIQAISLKAVLFADNVKLQDGLLIFNTDIQNYQFGRCDCMVIESIDASGYKSFVWRSDRTWRATYSSSQGYNVRTDTVSVTESGHIVHFEINLGDSGGAFYTGGVRVYGWNV